VFTHGSCLTVEYTDISFLCYPGSVKRDEGMWGNTEIGAAIHGMFRIWYSGFTYTHTPQKPPNPRQVLSILVMSIASEKPQVGACLLCSKCGGQEGLRRLFSRWMAHRWW